MSHDNAQIFKEGLEKAYGLIVNHLLSQARDNCKRLLEEVQRHRTFQGFTGNTQLSYMGGLYYDGVLQGIIENGVWTGMPRYQKVRKGQVKYLADPFEGEARFVRGKVQTDHSFGQGTSINFLRNYHAPKRRICFVITTGTEYSEYIETVRNLDVLTGTYEAAKGILIDGFKPIQM